MSGPVRPADPPPKRGKWILLALLVALAAFMYVSIIFKTSKYGF
jgi:MYXO-CTERM domain-containing protein